LDNDAAEPVDWTGQGIAINDMRKNISDLNDHNATSSAPGRGAVGYGIALEAVLITGIDSATGVGVRGWPPSHRTNPGLSSISLAARGRRPRRSCSPSGRLEMRR